MKEFKFLLDKKKGIVFAIVKVRIFGIRIFKNNFSCVNKKPRLGKRCWIAEKKHSAYLLNKKLSDEITEEYLKTKSTYKTTDK